MSFLVALQFLTTIPPILRRDADSRSFGRSVGYFPLVGLFIGLVLVGLDLLLGLLFPKAMVDLTLVLALVLLTGGLHLDGLADTSDAVFCRRSPDERMAIMKDSRVGTFGVVAVALVLLAKWAALGSIPGPGRQAVLLAMPVLARWVMSMALVVFPYGRPGSGLGSSFKEWARWPQLVGATVVAVAVAGLAWQFYGLLLVGIVAAMALVIIAYLLSKIPALTGDSYGALCEITEAFVLALASTGAWSDGWIR